MWGCAVDFTVLLDGKVVGTLRNGDTISVYTQDGPHTLLFQKGKKIDCSVSILISPEDKVWVVNTEISGSHLAVDSQYASNTTEATAFDRENSPRKQAKRSKGNVAFAVVIVVAALAALSLTFKSHSDNSSNDRPSPHQSNISTQLDNNLTPDSQPEEITISATDLWAAYKENTVYSDALYKDKILVVTGTIQNIGQDIVTKAPCISIETNDGYGLYPIQCFFPKNGDQTDLIAQLKDGDQIVIAGKCDGIPLAQVQLTKCSIR